MDHRQDHSHNRRFWRPDVRADVADELDTHIELRTQDLIAAGWSPERARAEAVRRFGAIDTYRSACIAIGERRQRGARWADWRNGLAQDVRYSLRSLRRTPGFTVIAAITLAIGIGASTAIFAVVNGVLLRPLPVRDEGRLVALWTRDRLGKFEHLAVPHHAYREFRAQTRAFADVAAMHEAVATPWAVADGDRTSMMAATLVTGTFFSVLGTPVHLGRTLAEADDVPGAPPVAVIGHGLWQRHFGGRSDVIGRRLRLGQTTYTVIGVAPAGFSYPKGTEVWLPLVPFDPSLLTNPRAGYLDLVGRLRPGATLEQGTADFGAYLARRAREHPTKTERVPAAAAFTDQVVGSVRHGLLVVSAAVGLLLLVAGVNLAGLMVARSMIRERELAVRAALGAGRLRIGRLLVTESVLLGILGGAAGALLGAVLIRIVVALAPAELPRFDEVRFDASVATLVVVGTLLVALTIGLGTAGTMVRHNLHDVLKRGTIAAGANRRILMARRVLVAGQVALAVVLLAGAGLLLRSLAALQQVPLGFQSEALIVARLSGPMVEPSRYIAMIDELEERLRGASGVRSIAPTLVPPFAGSQGFDVAFAVEGQETDAGATNPSAAYEVATESYFATLGIPVRQGRVFTSYDHAETTPVVVVNEALARQAWPGRDAIGQRIRIGQPGGLGEWRTVIGIVGDTRFRELTAVQPAVYAPLRQVLHPPAYLVIRATSDTASVLPVVRQAMAAVHPELVLPKAVTVRELLDGPLARPRFLAVVLGGFAAAALVIASVGLYGVMATLVRQRTREVGIRMALGARTGEVRRLVIGQGLAIALSGAVVGLVLAIGSLQLLHGMLYDVQPLDPLTLLGVALLLLTVTVVACYVPARRATRVDPASALRAG